MNGWQGSPKDQPWQYAVIESEWICYWLANSQSLAAPVEVFPDVCVNSFGSSFVLSHLVLAFSDPSQIASHWHFPQKSHKLLYLDCFRGIFSFCQLLFLGACFLWFCPRRAQLLTQPPSFPSGQWEAFPLRRRGSRQTRSQSSEFRQGEPQHKFLWCNDYFEQGAKLQPALAELSH